MSSLLTVTGGRIALEPNRTYVLGRSKDCDVIVQDVASSRRHAQLTVGGVQNACFLEDLGSRNGTFVNGERIDNRRPLEDGCRIRVGATIYLLSQLDVGEQTQDVMIDSGTVALERLSFGPEINEEILRVVRTNGNKGTDFAGQLGSFSVIEVLQLLIQTSRSGTLHVAVDGGHAQIEVRRGEVQSATYQELEGFQALMMLVRQKQGIFWLVECTDPVLITIRQAPNTLLFELCKAIDESA